MPCDYRGMYISNGGPRSTPSISEGRVYVHGVQGSLRCLDLATGRVVWQRGLAKELRTEGDFFEGTSVSLRLEFADPIEAEATGPVEIEIVNLRVQHGEDDIEEWETPAGACSGEFTSNEFAPTDFFEDRYLITGKARCDAPADPVDENTAEPVEIVVATST